MESFKGNSLAEGSMQQLVVITYNVHSMMLFAERLELLMEELAGVYWDVVVITESWREAKAEAFEIKHGHFWYGSGAQLRSNGVGFLVHRRWANESPTPEFKAGSLFWGKGFKTENRALAYTRA